jgi:hypothetical protein
MDFALGCPFARGPKFSETTDPQGVSAMDNAQHTSVRSAPLHCRRELTREEAQRELRCAEQIRAQSRRAQQSVADPSDGVPVQRCQHQV